MAKGLGDLGLTVEKLHKPTRCGNTKQKDTYVDLIITNCFDEVEDVKVGVQVSDHCLLSSALIGSKKEKLFKEKIDFANTYAARSQELENAFENYNWADLFSCGSLKETARKFNEAVLSL